MKQIGIILLLNFSYFARGQDIPVSAQQQLENLADIQQGETEDDSFVQQLEYLKKHPLDLNIAGAHELKELCFVTTLQIDNLIAYRRLLGKLTNLYELQSVPGWDLFTIRRALPYIKLGDPMSVVEDVKTRWKKGEKSLLFRISTIAERSLGFDKTTAGSNYLGSRAKIFFRYRYQYKNLLQWGITGDKDAGEQFFRGAARYGFDFYSVHLFARKIGKFEAIALGDFTVNMGQGLIQWQSLAFSKSADVLNVKRQSAFLRPYTSSGETNFQRGAGATTHFGNFEISLFGSVRRLSSNVSPDSVGHAKFFSSFENSGYHRTQAEIDDRNNLGQLAAGGNLAYRKNKWHAGINYVAYRFSIPLQRKPEPYNQFSIAGSNWNNLSLDFSYTYRNFHFFGEEACDKNFHRAFLNGLLVTVDPKVDLSFVQRTIDKKYQAVNADAFTENTYPTGEDGLYTGASLRPLPNWKVDIYADFFRFPWLKYLVDAPSFGHEFLVQATYAYGKQVEIYSRLKIEMKQKNQATDSGVMNYPVFTQKQSWRSEISLTTGPAITIRQRVETLWYDARKDDRETGFLVFFDVFYHPPLKPWSVNARWQYFETNGYDSRIYAYENDVLYNFSIPADFLKGRRYYINVSYDFKKFSFWIRLARTVYPNKTTTGSGLDEIPRNHRTELKLQIQKFF